MTPKETRHITGTGGRVGHAGRVQRPRARSHAARTRSAPERVPHAQETVPDAPVDLDARADQTTVKFIGQGVLPILRDVLVEPRRREAPLLQRLAAPTLA